jgi:hypothetical protein
MCRRVDVEAYDVAQLFDKSRSDNGPGDFADAFMVAIASRNPYLIDANRSSA